MRGLNETQMSSTVDLDLCFGRYCDLVIALLKTESCYLLLFAVVLASRNSSTSAKMHTHTCLKPGH